MGLDMYGYSMPYTKELDLPYIDESVQIDNDLFKDKLDIIWEGRKLRWLHNWVEKYYYELGGTEDFNCVMVKISRQLLDKLKKDVESGKIINYGGGGFFFGDYEYDEEAEEDIKDFIKVAEEYLNQNNLVFYDSWW